MKRIYLDNNATTAIHPEVAEVIKESLHLYGNPSSHHSFGREARSPIEGARANVAELIGARSDNILFTSGGSESNNLVLKGIACKHAQCPAICMATGKARGRHIITSVIEHPSVLETCRCLEAEGVEVTYLPVDEYGMVNPEEIEKAIKDNTGLISIMYANNEVGTIQPIQKIGQIARKHGILFHTDAVQAAGKIPLTVEELGCDYLSISGHKWNVPKGIGALFIRSGVGVCPLISGGHQEEGRRAGTENTLGIIALGKGSEVAKRDMKKNLEHLRRLRDRLEAGIKEKVTEIKINGHPEKRLPNTLNVSFRYIEGEAILYRLDADGIAVSTGSACSSGSLEPSHVLMAMKLDYEWAHGSIRFSLGHETTDEEIDYVLDRVPVSIEKLRAMSPLYRKKK